MVIEKVVTIDRIIVIVLIMVIIFDMINDHTSELNDTVNTT